MLWDDYLMGRTAALRVGRGGAGGFVPGIPPTEPPPPEPPDPSAFVGWGSTATGGGASVTHTINSNASDAFNAYRSALLSTAPLVHIKIIGNGYIDGGGVVLTVVRNNTTVEGPTWTKSTKRLGTQFKGNNLVISHFRQRPGDQVGAPADTDGFTLNPGKGHKMSQIVLDHVSISWGPDVTLGLLNWIEDLTIQYCLIGPGLYESTHPESPHSYGMNMTVPGNNPNSATEHSNRVTIYKTFWVHNWGRNVKLEHADFVDVVNPVVYNYGKEMGHGNPRGANVVGGMWKKGPDTKASNEVWEPDPNYAQFNQSIYLPVTGTDRNIGLGFTPTYNISAGARRSSEYGGGLHNVTVEEPDATLASAVVAGAGHGITDATDQIFKDDFENGTGSFWYGPGTGSPNPSWP